MESYIITQDIYSFRFIVLYSWLRMPKSSKHKANKNKKKGKEKVKKKGKVNADQNDRNDDKKTLSTDRHYFENIDPDKPLSKKQKRKLKKQEEKKKIANDQSNNQSGIAPSSLEQSSLISGNVDDIDLSARKDNEDVDSTQESNVNSAKASSNHDEEIVKRQEVITSEAKLGAEEKNIKASGSKTNTKDGLTNKV